MPYVNGKLKGIGLQYPKLLEFWEAVANYPLCFSTWTDNYGNFALYMTDGVKYHGVTNEDGHRHYAPGILDVQSLPLTQNLTYGTTDFIPGTDQLSDPPPRTDVDRIVFYRMNVEKGRRHGLKKLLKTYRCLVWRAGGCEMGTPDDADDASYDLSQAEVAAFLKENEEPLEIAGFERYEIPDVPLRECEACGRPVQ